MRPLARLAVPLLAVLLLLPARARSAPDAARVADPKRRLVTRLYPYVVPKEYLPYSGAVAEGLARPLGHGLYVVLVFDLDGMVGNATAADLARLGLTPDQARARALENLEALAEARELQLAVFATRSGRPFVLVGGSWAAATAILLPRLRDLVAGPLGTREIAATIPHREALLLFPLGDQASRDEMRALVRENERDGRKPLTWELFTLTDGGVKELKGR